MKNALTEARFQFLAGIINENESKQSSELVKRVGQLYGTHFIKTEYDEKIVKKWGQDVVDAAIEWGPKVLAYKNKLKSIADEVKNSTEGKILLALLATERYYSSNSGDTDVHVSNLFNLR
jgi:hypothetical protein